MDPVRNSSYVHRAQPCAQAQRDVLGGANCPGIGFAGDRMAHFSFGCGNVNPGLVKCQFIHRRSWFLSICVNTLGVTSRIYSQDLQIWGFCQCIVSLSLKIHQMLMWWEITFGYKQASPSIQVSTSMPTKAKMQTWPPCSIPVDCTKTTTCPFPKENASKMEWSYSQEPWPHIRFWSQSWSHLTATHIS